MCGIVGYTGRLQAVPFLLDGLKALEYRGYDSAGIEVLKDDALQGVKCAGRVGELVERCARENLDSTCGIAHTRWATHGAPTDRNAHPHCDSSGRIALVHNGIIENYQELREALMARGYEFLSETDSEVVAHLMREALTTGTAKSLVEALRVATDQLKGSWAIVAMSADEPGVLACARQNSPLVLASTSDGVYAASDVTPLAPVTSQVIQLENGEFAVLSPEGTVSIIDAAGNAVSHPSFFDIDQNASAATLEGYPDFMAKEIAEQPDSIERFLAGRLTPSGIRLDELNLSDEAIAAIDRIYVVACGTSYHVALIARTLIEHWAKIPVVVEPASEFNYKDLLVTNHTLCIVITQSGETADTLAALRRIRKLGACVLAVTNVIGSSAAREADGVLYVQAGLEVSVCSTKAYTAQMVASVLIALFLAHKNGQCTLDEVTRHFHDLQKLPDLIRTVLDRSWQDEAAAKVFERAPSALFLGRGVNATTAAEGALKLKEISYLHAEAYPAGEMKHGPIALLQPDFPVVVIVPNDCIREKMISSIQEVRARGAICVAVATDGDEKVASLAEHVLWVPPTYELYIPIVAVVHLQMLARYVAGARGCDVDKPRNLAKSVTVE